MDAPNPITEALRAVLEGQLRNSDRILQFFTNLYRRQIRLEATNTVLKAAMAALSEKHGIDSKEFLAGFKRAEQEAIQLALEQIENCDPNWAAELDDRNPGDIDPK